MQILNGGSFVNLDSAEKIEQLVFTAKQIAQTAIETEGFVNDESNNRQIALDIWQGAEYMTREHEEAQVKNIFVKNFIEELRELKNANRISGESVSNTANAIETNETGETVNPIIKADERDVFLGFLAPTETEEKANSAVQIETSPVAAVLETANRIEDFKTDSSESETNVNGEASSDFKSEDVVAADMPEEPLTETESEISTESNSVNPPTIQTVEDSGAKQISQAAQTAIGAIALPEKEPYQFDKCTVTATIQLLPVEADASRRKVVLSVRTHDFAPQISVIETAKELYGEEILPALEKAFEKYRSNLPLKVMDKLRREKSSAKRQSSASKTSTNTAKDVAPTAELSARTNNANAESVVAAPKPEIGKTPVEVVGGAEIVAAKPASISNTKSFNPKVGKTNDAQGSLFNF